MNSASPPATSRVLSGAAVLLFIVGGLTRLFPLADWPNRVYWQFLSEDGYLMQTVARNFALGLGLSTADGTMPTNGVQPLATFVFAALHGLVNGNKLLAIAAVAVLSTAQALLAAWAMAHFIRQLAGDPPQARSLGALGAGLWLCGYVLIAHSGNGLETGLYHLAVLAAWLVYLRQLTAQALRPATTSESMRLGVALGLVFLARNDAVFFIGGLLAAHVWIGGEAGGGILRRLRDATIAGLTSLATASPWLVHNKLLFGSIVPISGSAQSHDSVLGQNLTVVPANLLEAMLVLLPIPGAVERSGPVLVAGPFLVIVLLLGFGYWSRGRGVGVRRMVVASTLFLGGLVGYYGLFFGAAHFIPRYLSVLSVLLWPMLVLLTGALADRVQTRWQGLRPLGVAGLVVLCAVSVNNARLHWNHGEQHMHRQVAEWVTEHVAPEVWVGAVQTGTLGYFHDRTINLDGKVNPEALKVILRTGDVRDAYIMDSPIQHIIDWVAVTDWATKPGAPTFKAAFDVAVRDTSLNLGVLTRRHPPADTNAH